jgi:hypothetical protein
MKRLVLTAALAAVAGLSAIPASAQVYGEVGPYGFYVGPDRGYVVGPYGEAGRWDRRHWRYREGYGEGWYGRDEDWRWRHRYRDW